MSAAHTPDAGPSVDVLLVIDIDTLLDRYPDAANAPVQVDRDSCFGLASGREALTVVNTEAWRIAARPGQRLRIRWTPLAMRGEHQILLQLAAADEATLGALKLHVDADAVRHVPQSGAPEHPVARTAVDAYWQADVVASGTTQVNVEAVATDRDAAVLARFRWPLRIVVT